MVQIIIYFALSWVTIFFGVIHDVPMQLKNACKIQISSKVKKKLTKHNRSQNMYVKISQQNPLPTVQVFKRRLSLHMYLLFLFSLLFEKTCNIHKIIFYVYSMTLGLLLAFYFWLCYATHFIVYHQKHYGECLVLPNWASVCGSYTLQKYS